MSCNGVQGLNYTNPNEVAKVAIRFLWAHGTRAGAKRWGDCGAPYHQGAECCSPVVPSKKRSWFSISTHLFEIQYTGYSDLYTQKTPAGPINEILYQPQSPVTSGFVYSCLSKRAHRKKLSSTPRRKLPVHRGLYEVHLIP